MQIVVKPRSSCAGTRGERRFELGDVVPAGERSPGAADELELVRVASGGPQCRPQPLQVGGGDRAERVEAVPVLDEAAHEPPVQALAPEPQPGPGRTERLRLEVDLVEPVVRPRERRGRVAPEDPPGREVLVEQLAAPLERDAERLVLGPVPAHRRLDDQPPLREEVERRKLLREQERMAERARSPRAAIETEASRRGGHRGQQEEGGGPGRARVLVSRQCVLARVRGQAGCARVRAEHDVLADHHPVEARRLGGRSPSARAPAGRVATRASSSRSERESASAPPDDYRASVYADGR